MSFIISLSAEEIIIDMSDGTVITIVNVCLVLTLGEM